MKIKDLKFNPQSYGTGTWAKIKFPNGYGASIITGFGAYVDSDQPYEIAVLGQDGRLCYDTPITDDVVGYCTEARANEILAQIEALPKPLKETLCQTSP